MFPGPGPGMGTSDVPPMQSSSLQAISERLAHEGEPMLSKTDIEVSNIVPQEETR